MIFFENITFKKTNLPSTSTGVEYWCPFDIDTRLQFSWAQIVAKCATEIDGREALVSSLQHATGKLAAAFSSLLC